PPAMQSSAPSRKASLTDSLAPKEAAQVVGQRRGALVAPGGLLLQALETDRFQVARQTRDQLSGRLESKAAEIVWGGGARTEVAADQVGATWLVACRLSPEQTRWLNSSNHKGKRSSSV